MPMKYRGRLRIAQDDLDIGQWTSAFIYTPARHVVFDLGKGKFGIMYRVPNTSRTKLYFKVIVFSGTKPDVIESQHMLVTDKIAGRYPTTLQSDIKDEDVLLGPGEASDMDGMFHGYQPHAVTQLSSGRFAVVVGSTSGMATIVFFIQWDGAAFITGRSIPAVNAGDTIQLTPTSDVIAKKWRGHNSIGLDTGTQRIVSNLYQTPAILPDSRDTFYLFIWTNYERTNGQRGSAVAYRKFTVTGNDVEALGAWSIRAATVIDPITGGTTGPEGQYQKTVRIGNYVYTTAPGGATQSQPGNYIVVGRTDLDTGNSTVKLVGPMDLGRPFPISSIVPIRGGGVGIMVYDNQDGDS
jgi:hypothetical protein